MDETVTPFDNENNFDIEPALDIMDPEEMYDEFRDGNDNSSGYDFGIPKIFHADDISGNPVSDNIVNLVNVSTLKKVEIDKLASKYPFQRTARGEMRR
ncbi:hypothetical protein SNE40_018025 [Patella caerulea]|uniref:Uncharacterized protein n=1 Tax=Patella caerulea TaxID=87958 RepID=A0AAN8P758_PATCE